MERAELTEYDDSAVTPSARPAEELGPVDFSKVVKDTEESKNEAQEEE